MSKNICQTIRELMLKRKGLILWNYRVYIRQLNYQVNIIITNWLFEFYYFILSPHVSFSSPGYLDNVSNNWSKKKYPTA